MQMNYLLNLELYFYEDLDNSSHNFQLSIIYPPNVRKSKIHPNLTWRSIFVLGEVTKSDIAHQILDKEYLIHDPEPIMMGKLCWLDASIYCYILNKSISYQILFGNFVLILMI